jgi:hypothetical protein
MSEGVWILEKGIVQEGGDILGVWTGPNAKDAGNTRFDQIAWTVNSDPSEIVRGDGAPGNETGTAYVSGRGRWLYLGYYENGWTKGN